MAVAVRDHEVRASGAEGEVRWIDLDDAAMAPRGLDVGNFVAHLRRDAVVGADRQRGLEAVEQGAGGRPEQAAEVFRPAASHERERDRERVDHQRPCHDVKHGALPYMN